MAFDHKAFDLPLTVGGLTLRRATPGDVVAAMAVFRDTGLDMSDGDLTRARAEFEADVRLGTAMIVEDGGGPAAVVTIHVQGHRLRDDPPNGASRWTLSRTGVGSFADCAMVDAVSARMAKAGCGAVAEFVRMPRGSDMAGLSRGGFRIERDRVPDREDICRRRTADQALAAPSGPARVGGYMAMAAPRTPAGGTAWLDARLVSALDPTATRRACAVLDEAMAALPDSGEPAWASCMSGRMSAAALVCARSGDSPAQHFFLRLEECLQAGNPDGFDALAGEARDAAAALPTPPAPSRDGAFGRAVRGGIERFRGRADDKGTFALLQRDADRRAARVDVADRGALAGHVMAGAAAAARAYGLGGLGQVADLAADSHGHGMAPAPSYGEGCRISP